MNNNKRKKEIRQFLRKNNIWKTFSWRALSVILSFFTAYFLTGSLKTGGIFAAIDSVLKVLFYYFHELRWQKWTTKKIRNIKKKYNERKKDA